MPEKKNWMRKSEPALRENLDMIIPVKALDLGRFIFLWSWYLRGGLMMSLHSTEQLHEGLIIFPGMLMISLWCSEQIYSRWWFGTSGYRYSRRITEIMVIRCILTELPECKVHEKCSCFLTSAPFFGTLSCNNPARIHQITMVLWQFLIGLQYTIGLCKLIFNWASSLFT